MFLASVRPVNDVIEEELRHHGRRHVIHLGTRGVYEHFSQATDF
jgi:hypothetical protein